MQKLWRTAAILIWPAIVWLGSACDRLEAPTGRAQFGVAVGGPGKATGGGQINVVVDGTSGTATFGFNAKHEEGTDVVSGHLNYVNHVSGVHLNCEVESGGVTPAQDGSPAFGTFGGYDCTPNSTFSNFTFDIVDQGEPGRNDPLTDAFTINYGPGITEGGPIRSGNIQIHKTQELVVGSDGQ